MSELIPFRADHLYKILSEPANESLRGQFAPELCKDLESTDSMSFVYNGMVQVCGGITTYWPGRGQVWSVFSDTTKNNFVPTFRVIRRWLRLMIDTKYHRIELSVDAGFPIGRRRAEMLGFQMECARARKYLPDGADCALYALVRD